MITTETVNRIVRFHGRGQLMVSLYARIDPGVSQAEVQTRVLICSTRPARWSGTRRWPPVAAVGTRRHRNDIGSSYWSAIFYTSDARKQVAEGTTADVDASGLWPGKVFTEIEPAGPFWEAEPEHQG